jgi:cytochrome c1
MVSKRFSEKPDRFRKITHFWHNCKTCQVYLIWATAIFGLLIFCACRGGAVTATTQQIPASDPDRGVGAIQVYGCGSCHTIPGVPGAHTTVGPPLTNWANRHYIAGSLSNTPENLIFWIRNPQEVEPGTAMPNMDVTEQDARDIAAYLYTLTEE